MPQTLLEAIRSLREEKEEEFGSFEEMMDFLAADEQEAIDGYDRILAEIDDEHVKAELEKIRIEEIAHKEFLEQVKNDRSAIYVEPLDTYPLDEHLEKKGQ